MQQEAVAHQDDFGPDLGSPPSHALRPGVDPPFANYGLGAAYDEMFDSKGSIRPHYAALAARLATLAPEELVRRQQACELSFLQQGITFTVYSDAQATGRIIPTDLLPRIVTHAEGQHIEAGLKKGIVGLNLFLRDFYGGGRVLKDRLVPRSMIYGSKHYRREMRGLQVPHNAYINVCGTDLVRREDGAFVVLEDNLRVPSGVSYMLANRDVVRRAFPAVFRSMGVRAIEHYPQELLATLRSLAPYHEDVSIAVLTPGGFNSAYFEDAFVDPLAFREDSSLGVPGMFNAYRAGNVVIANAPGTGIADDKALYAYVPRIIRYYLSEDPILDNVETFLCRDERSLSHVLSNLHKLTLKAAGVSRAYAMLIAPHA